MQLKITSWKALCSILDGIPQKDLPTTADVRKVQGFLSQARKGISKSIEEWDKIESDSRKAVNDFQKKLEPFRKDKTPEELEKDPKVSKMVKEFNKKLEPFNKKFKDWEDQYSQEEVVIDIDANYLSYIKEIWEEKLRPSYLNTEVMLETAEAIGV